MKNSIIFFFVTLLFLSFQSCTKTNDFEVKINPQNGAVISIENTKSLPLEILILSEVEIYETTVKLYAKNTPDLFIINETSYDSLFEFKFNKTVDLNKYSSGTEFVFLVSLTHGSDGVDLRDFRTI